MADILLATLNARYIHSAFGLRCLAANMQELETRTAIREFDISQRPADIAEVILHDDPRIVGIGVYVWNVTQSTQVVSILKRIRPDLVVVLGGPEVSHEPDLLSVVQQADYLIAGEGDLAFRKLCRRLLASDPPADKIIQAPLPDLDSLRLPYSLYTEEDIAHRIVYVESSRGCPYHCEFCLSSLAPAVRYFPQQPFLDAMEGLLQRGARHFKFVDRTFNLDCERAGAILHFFLERHLSDLFLHFEMVPDRLPEKLRDLLAAFPPGTLQLEIGVQTFNPRVARLIRRVQDYPRLEEHLRWLRHHTGTHLHTDLVLGLPGEDLASIQQGFDRLVELGPQEIQVGMLKRLKGAPIARHDREWKMVYDPAPPYEVLATGSIDYLTMQRLKRFARFWDMMFNSGHFLDSVRLIWDTPGTSPFRSFMDWSDWLFSRVPTAQQGVALQRLAELLFTFLTEVQGRDPEVAALRIGEDLQRDRRRDLPDKLRPFIEVAPGSPSHQAGGHGTRRQQRHRR